MTTREAVVVQLMSDRYPADVGIVGWKSARRRREYFGLPGARRRHPTTGSSAGYRPDVSANSFVFRQPTSGWILARRRSE